MTKKLTPYIVPTSGESIVLFPVSLSTQTMQIRDAMPEPQPPVLAMDYGGIIKHERNGADPDYLESYRTWENLVQIEATTRILKLIASKQQMTDEKREEVAELREIFPNDELYKSDKLAWFFNVAIGSDNDIKSILTRCGELADPTEGGIKRKADGF